MSARLITNTYNISANCPSCQTTASFEQKHIIIVNWPNEPNFGTPSPPKRSVYILSQCANCQRGGFAAIYDRGSVQSADLKEFYPFSVTFAPLPQTVPKDIEVEFREAEKCAALGLNRAASALFRSVLEKVLKVNGYTKTNDSSLRDLQKRIDAVAADGVITEARKKKAHEDIRSLGNDVLHDDWREVTKEEVEDSHRYTQRILEDLYDDRASVETILIAKGKLSAPAQPTNP